MITNKSKSVKQISQDYYDEFIDNLNLNSLVCPNDGCGHHNFVRHGYYERTIKFIYTVSAVQQIRNLLVEILYELKTLNADHKVVCEELEEDLPF